MFLACFLFSFAGEAKLLTTKEVAAAKKQKSKQMKAPRKVVRLDFDQPPKAKKTTTPSRKVVRLDFDQPAKAKKEIKPVAKAEPPKKTFKSISCHNGFIVGQKAYCSTTKSTLTSSVKKGRSVASVPKSGKKLKPSKKF
jgi:hypothetical protein